MLQKVFKTGNSLVVSLSKEMLELLGVSEGSRVSVHLDRENRQIIIGPVEGSLAALGMNEAHARQVADFIAQYRPALEALSKL